MEPQIAASAPAASATPLDAAYCGPEPDFTEISAMFAHPGFEY